MPWFFGACCIFLLAANAGFEADDYTGAAALYAHAGPPAGQDAENFKAAGKLAASTDHGAGIAAGAADGGMRSELF